MPFRLERESSSSSKWGVEEQMCQSHAAGATLTLLFTIMNYSQNEIRPRSHLDFCIVFLSEFVTLFFLEGGGLVSSLIPKGC